VGMIVARELKKRDCGVAAVIEQRGVCGGLERNRIKCLEDNNIPLAYNSTVAKIHGTPRITGVTVQNLVTGEYELIECDTLIVSVGLIPERELLEGVAAQTGGIPPFLSVCGNARVIFDMTDAVSIESERAGKLAAAYAGQRDSQHS